MVLLQNQVRQCNFSLRSLLISDKPDHFRLFKWSIEMRQWSDFLQSCKGTHCHCACFILLFSLSPSSLQSCHFTLRMADLIPLLISLSPLFSLSLSLLSLSLSPTVPLSHSLFLSQSADLRTLCSYSVNLKCSLQWNDKNTCSTINCRMIFFSFFFSVFAAVHQMLRSIKFLASTLLFFTRKKQIEMRSLSSASNMAWSSPPRQCSEGRSGFFDGIAGMPAQIFNQLEIQTVSN